MWLCACCVAQVWGIRQIRPGVVRSRISNRLSYSFKHRPMPSLRRPICAGSMPPPISKEQAVKESVERADKLIAVFREQKQEDWKHLLGFSQQWWEIADSVFDRISELAEASENPDEELDLRRLGRMLRETHNEVHSNRRVWTELTEAKPDELVGCVTANYDAINSNGFYEYVRDVIGRIEHNDESTEAQVRTVKELAERIGSIVQDLAIGVDDDVRDNMNKILSAPTIDEKKKEIDRLAESGELDPRYLTLMTKAYADGKDTDFTKQDHEETTMYMYEQMRLSMRKQQPLEIRLLKYVLAFPTPRERKEALEEVLQPGVRFDDEGWHTAETTSPEVMLSRVEDLLQKYRLNVQKFGELEPRPIYRSYEQRGTVDKNDIMRDLVVDSVYMYVPEVMERLEEVRVLLKKEFVGQSQVTKDIKMNSDGKIITPDQDDVLLQGDNFIEF